MFAAVGARTPSLRISGSTAGSPYEGYPGDPRTSAEVDISTSNVGCTSCSNITIGNLKMVGSDPSGAILLFVSTNNIFINGNWIVDTVNGPIHIYDADNIFIQGNKFDTGTTFAGNGVGLYMPRSDSQRPVHHRQHLPPLQPVLHRGAEPKHIDNDDQ